MRAFALICGVVVAAMMPVAAQADDPHDPAMRNAAARARDSARTRELNRQENTRLVRTGVRWGAPHTVGGEAADQDYQRDMAEYRRRRARYEADMAQWRHAVAACEAGDYAACDNR